MIRDVKYDMPQLLRLPLPIPHTYLYKLSDSELYSTYLMGVMQCHRSEISEIPECVLHCVSELCPNLLFGDIVPRVSTLSEVINSRIQLVRGLAYVLDTGACTYTVINADLAQISDFSECTVFLTLMLKRIPSEKRYWDYVLDSDLLVI